MNLRKIVSLSLFISLLLLTLTSIILYIVPHGRVAYWTDWHLWGLTKTQWGNLHINIGFFFLLAGLCHVVYNWRSMIAYLKNRGKEIRVFTPSFNISLSLTLLVVVGTLLNIPPLSTIINWGDAFKDAAAQKYGEPPYGHAELSTLQRFAKQTDLDLAKAKALLQAAHIVLSSDQQSILEISKENNLSPRDLAHIMASARIQSSVRPTFPAIPPAGFGARRLAVICGDYGLERGSAIQELSKKKIQADPQQTIKEIAVANNMTPHALFEILHGLANQ